MKTIKIVLIVLVLLALIPSVEAVQGGGVAIPEGSNFQKFQEEMIVLQEKVRRGEISMMGAQKLQKKIGEKYGINMEGVDSLSPELLEGLDMSQATSPMTPIGVIPYTAQVSDRWNQVLSERHGKKPFVFGMPPFIYRVKRWTQPPSQEALGGADPHPFLRALDEQTILTPSLVKVFSNPQSYLKTDWDVSKIDSIILVPPVLEGEPAFQIPYVHRYGNPGKYRYSFYIPEGLSEFEILRMMQYLQRKADGEDVGDFSLYEGLVGLPEQVTREANENLDGIDEEDAVCPDDVTDITTRDQSGGAKEISPEKIAELWEKALTEPPQPTEEELQNGRIGEDFLKKWQEQERAWDDLEEIGSDDIVEKLRGIIFSSASPRVRGDAFQTLLNILENRKDMEGLFGLLEQGISDPQLEWKAYSHLENLWYVQNIPSHQRTRIETIILGQLETQTAEPAISFFLSHSDTSHSNQIRAIFALDSYLATASPQEKRPVQFGNNIIGGYAEGGPTGLLHHLLNQVHQRLGLKGPYGFNAVRIKKTSEDSEEAAQSLTSDDLYFVNQAMSVIVNHIGLVDDRFTLEGLIRSPLMPQNYKGELKERVRQLIGSERAELDQQLGDLGK